MMVPEKELQIFEKLNEKMQWIIVRMEDMKIGDVIRKFKEDEIFKVTSEPCLAEFQDMAVWGVQVEDDNPEEVTVG